MIIRPLLEYFFPRGEMNRRKSAWGKIIKITYAGMFLFTFGHVTAQHPANDRQWAPCGERVAIDGTTVPASSGSCLYILNERGEDITFLKSFTSGVAWPLFWSWHLQAEKPHD